MALARLDAAGANWRLLLESAGVAGIVAALEAGIAISVLAQNGLPKSLKALSEAEGLPPLPDFEYVLLRHAKASDATNTLAEVIIDFFQLSAALRNDAEQNRRTERSINLERERQEPGRD